MNTSPSASTHSWGWSSLPKFVREPDPEIYLRSNNYVCLDFETTSTEKGDAGIDANKLILAVWLDGEVRGSGVGRIRVCRAGERGQRELLERIQRADFIIAHNAKFELKWLHRIGIDLRTILPYCTQIGEFVLAGNRPRHLSLDTTARRYGLAGKSPLASILIKSGYPVEEIPEKDLEEYCTNDVRITHEIFLRQREELSKLGLLRVHYCRNIATPALSDIEYKGTRIDETRVKPVFESVMADFKAKSNVFEEITGGINFDSPKQVREYLYDKLRFDELLDYRGNPVRTKGGLKTTKKENVEKLEPTTPEQRKFKKALLDIMPLKRKVQILEQMVKCCKEDNGRVYATFNQTVARTHRLSSTGGKWGFQFHNFPREFKPLFRARRDGWNVIEADAPQLEFRVAVDLGCDARGKDDILKGVDIHGFSASELRVDRQSAKAFTFRPLYGGNAGTPRQRAYFQAFRERYANLYAAQTAWVYEVLGTKELTTITGLKFYWPDTRLMRSGYITNRESIFNYPIQSFATADIMPLTLVLVWHYSRDLDVKIVNTVHDSIIADVLPEAEEEYKEILRKAFTEDIYSLLFKLYNYKFTTPLGVGIKVSTHWGDTDKEIKYEARI